VVEVAARADFNGVTLDRFFAALEFGEFRARRGTRPSGGQSCAEDVGHLHQILRVADGTVFTGGASQIVRRAQQFGVRVADVFATNLTLGQFGEQGATDETELNDRTVG
jgi:hypothetical protein